MNGGITNVVSTDDMRTKLQMKDTDMIQKPTHQ